MRYLKPLILMLVLAISITACQNTSIPTDSVACVYGAGGNDGLDLKDQYLPGSEPFDARDRRVVEIPTSNRFYLITTNDATRDPGAPAYIAAPDSPENGITELRWEVKNDFVFNAQPSCEWFNQHGLRNAVDYNMGFNVRGEVTPWMQWLAENFGTSMQRAVNEVSREFSWEQLVFDHPIGANALGVLPDDATEEDQRLARRVAEERLVEVFTAELNDRIGTAEGVPFFCDIGHNQATPEDCENIGVEIVDINPTDTSLVEGRQQIQAEQANLDNAEQLAEIAEQQVALDDANRERAETAAIADAESEARQQAAQLRAELGITDAEVDILELEVLRAQNNASLQVAPCTAIGATGLDCVLLLAVLNGVDLPTVLGELGSSVQVQADGG